MIAALYEFFTGRPWITVRSAAVEFGPPPGAVHAERLARFTDAELLAHHDTIRADLARRSRREVSRVQAR
jgi:hypothetical protein